KNPGGRATPERSAGQFRASPIVLRENVESHETRPSQDRAIFALRKTAHEDLYGDLSFAPKRKRIRSRGRGARTAEVQRRSLKEERGAFCNSLTLPRSGLVR